MQKPERLIEDGLAFYGIEYDAAMADCLVRFVGELVRWSRTMNLVGLKEEERIVVDLLYDAFFLHTRLRDAGSVLDLGSGSGVVALPLAVLNPNKRIFSMDSNLKKITFQRAMKRLLGLGGLEIVHGRAEDIKPLGADALVAKAFGPGSSALLAGARHLKEGGAAFLVKGGREEASLQTGFVLEMTEAYHLPKSRKTYQLFVYKKVS